MRLLIFVTDCYVAKEQGLSLPGTFTLQIDSETTIKAFCDADGYTYLMSRGQFQNPKDYFNKNWNGYKTAFGETSKKREKINLIDNILYKYIYLFHRQGVLDWPRYDE